MMADHMPLIYRMNYLDYIACIGDIIRHAAADGISEADTLSELEQLCRAGKVFRIRCGWYTVYPEHRSDAMSASHDDIFSDPLNTQYLRDMVVLNTLRSVHTYVDLSQIIESSAEVGISEAEVRGTIEWLMEHGVIYSPRQEKYKAV